MKAVVVGGGVGGLCASIRLAASGHHVTLLERNPVVGGKLAALSEGGYTFDLGPTLLTMPHLYDEVPAAGRHVAGRSGRDRPARSTVPVSVAERLDARRA